MTELLKTSFTPLLNLDLQFFSEQDPEPNTQGNEDPTQSADPNAGGSGNPEGKQEEPVKKLEFTQDEFDAIIKDRLNRALKKYDGFDELKTFKEEADQKAEEARKQTLTEIERAQEEAKTAAERAETLEQELATLRESNKKQQITNEFIKQAGAKNIAFVDDALVLAASQLSQVEIGEDGKAQGVDAIVESLVTTKPFLLGAQKQEGKQIGGSTGPDPKDEVKTLSQQLDEAKKAKNFNLVVELSNKIRNLTK